MSKISNALIMIELLQSGKKYSINELSKELGVSDRMIRYYKEQLELAGFYIESYKGPNGGYFINPNNFNIKYFNKYDLQILDGVKNELHDNNSKLMDDFSILTEKLKNAYTVNKENSEYTEISVILNNPTEKEKELIKAIEKKKNLKIVYLNVDGKFVAREIVPIMFFNYNDATYLTAFCKLRGAIRHFNINNIVEYKVL